MKQYKALCLGERNFLFSEELSFKLRTIASNASTHQMNIQFILKSYFEVH